MIDVDAAAALLEAGEAVVIPTDTVYGVAALPERVDLLRELKHRPASVPVAVLVASVEQAESLVDLGGAGARLAAEHWPGPLTIVARRRAGAGTLGVRLPDHDVPRALAAAVGPIATTSANRHGEPTPATAAAAAAAVGLDADHTVDGGTLAGTASTVVDVTGAEVRILRAGLVRLDGGRILRRE